MKALAAAVWSATLLSGLKPVQATQASLTPGTAVLDPFTTTAYVVEKARADGRLAFCQLRVGVFEPGRPDAARLILAVADPPAVVHPTLNPAKLLDPSQKDLIFAVLDDRLALCAAKFFDGALLTDLPPAWHANSRDEAELTERLAALARRHGLTAVVKTS